MTIGLDLLPHMIQVVVSEDKLTLSKLQFFAGTIDLEGVTTHVVGCRIPITAWHQEAQLVPRYFRIV